MSREVSVSSLNDRQLSNEVVINWKEARAVLPELWTRILRDVPCWTKEARKSMPILFKGRNQYYGAGKTRWRRNSKLVTPYEITLCFRPDGYLPLKMFIHELIHARGRNHTYSPTCQFTSETANDTYSLIIMRKILDTVIIP